MAKIRRQSLAETTFAMRLLTGFAGVATLLAKFDVKPADPLTLTVAGVAFATVALLVCLLPARRAGRVDLMEALRQE